MTYIPEQYPKKGQVFERLLALLMVNDGASPNSSNIPYNLNDKILRGGLNSDRNHQQFVDQLFFSGSPTAGIDLITTNDLLVAVCKALSILNRNPHLTLHSYYAV